jgi:uncharacterized protein YlaN (UPF0358 family)
MKTLFTLSFAVLFIATAAFAQTFTKEQDAIWKLITAHNENLTKGDIDAYAVMLHNDYQGWSNQDSLPVNKSTLTERLKTICKTAKINASGLKPLSITITKRAAVVDYMIDFTLVANEKGKTVTTTLKGKNVDFLVKEGGKWFILGDMTVFQMK